MTTALENAGQESDPERVAALALELPEHLRSALADRLYASLGFITDSGLRPDQEADLLNRLEKYRSGQLTAEPYEVVMARLRSRFSGA